MQGGKNWILPKEMNANRLIWYSHWLEIWSNHLFPPMGPNGGIVDMDSVHIVPLPLSFKIQHMETFPKKTEGHNTKAAKAFICWLPRNFVI